MISSRPYLIRAIYEWLTDSLLTPYILVDTRYTGVVVPIAYVENDSIVLNIQQQAVSKLVLGNEAIEFQARFSGQLHNVYLPIVSVKSIYAHETNQGMLFQEEDDQVDDEGGTGRGKPDAILSFSNIHADQPISPERSSISQQKTSTKKNPPKKPNLTLVD